MKQLQIPLEDELMMQLKMNALQNGTTLKAIITTLVTNYLNEEPTPAPKKKEKKKATPKKEEPKQPEPVIVPEPEPIPEPEPKKDLANDPIFYWLRKTHRTGKPEKLMRQYRDNKGVTWMILDGYKAHYDEDGNLIPFRFTDDKGEVFEPDAEELAELSEAHGKPVEIEK